MGTAHGSGVFLGRFVLEDLDFVLLAREDHRDKSRSAVGGTVRCETAEQWPNLVLGPQIGLSVALLGHLKSHLHSLEELIVSLLGAGFVEARVLVLSLLIKLDPLGDIESVGPEETIDLLFKLWYVFLVEGGLEDLR